MKLFYIVDSDHIPIFGVEVSFDCGNSTLELMKNDCIEFNSWSVGNLFYFLDENQRTLFLLKWS